MTMRYVVGDCRAVMAGMPAESVHCVVTSPPYWGLRDYGLPSQVWGGDPACAHDWELGRPVASPLFPMRPGLIPDLRPPERPPQPTGTCRRCNAWLGTLGLEPDYRMYVEHLVEVFREVHRVLRPDGTAWLNLGDCFATTTKGSGGHNPKQDSNKGSWMSDRKWHIPDGLKPKDLVGIPWRVAFALQDDGWYNRGDIVWSKPNPMPESVRDRPTRAHEFLFLLARSERYFYDADAIAEPSVSDHPNGNGYRREARLSYADDAGPRGDDKQWRDVNGTRNKRSVWTITPHPFAGRHFASFPPTLVEPCVRAGTSERGACAKCGAQWTRVVKRTPMDIDRPNWRPEIGGRTRASGTMLSPPMATTTGWEPACSCGADVIPATVLDPFGGTGTTGLVADGLGRQAVVIDLSPDYAELASVRVDI